VAKLFFDNVLGLLDTLVLPTEVDECEVQNIDFCEDSANILIFTFETHNM
jgi:hypothetical protein